MQKLIKAEHQREQIEEILFTSYSEKYVDCIAATDLFYHQDCLRKHKSVIVTNSKEKQENQRCIQIRSQSNKFAIKCLTEFIQTNVIEKNQIYSLLELYEIYSVNFKAEMVKNAPDIECAPYRRDYVQQQLEKAMDETIKIVQFKSKNYVCSCNLDSNEAIRLLEAENKNDITTKIKNIADNLRKIILSMPIKKIPKHNITEHNIKEGECDIPPELYLFIEHLLLGCKADKKEKNFAKQVKIKAICDTIIYCISNGQVKPSTHLSVGLVMKSKTNSRSVLDILNKIGFSMSYNVCEEIETELAYTNSSNECILPYGLLPNNENLCTAVAFDNYDRYVETVSGTDTLHDTVGIVFQNTITNIEPLNYNQAADTSTFHYSSIRRRRRYISPLTDDIQPYIRTHSVLPLLNDLTIN